MGRAAGESGEQGDERGGFDGLGDVVIEAGLEGALSVFGSCEGGEGDGREVADAGTPGAKGADEIVAVAAGHADVADDQVGAERVEGFDGFVDGGGDGGDGAVHFEESFDQAAGIRLVVEGEDLDAGEGGGGGTGRRFVTGPPLMSRPIGGLAGSGDHGEADDEGGPAQFAGAFDGDVAGVHLGEALDDGESESEAAVPADGGGVGLSEAFEEVGEEFGGDAGAGVADEHFGVLVGAAEGDADGAGGGGELDAVGEQVPDDLLEAGGIAGDADDAAGAVGDV